MTYQNQPLIYVLNIIENKKIYSIILISIDQFGETPGTLVLNEIFVSPGMEQARPPTPKKIYTIKNAQIKSQTWDN